MARLFDGADLAFLESQRGYRHGMASRLRRARREVLSLYLPEVRDEFRRAWAHCRTLGSSADRPEDASAALRQLFVFYGLFAALRLQCLLGRIAFVRVDAGGLLALVRRLQQQASPGSPAPAHWRAIAARSR
jgi:hypothetical protein